MSLLTQRGAQRKALQVVGKVCEDNEGKFTLGDVASGWLQNDAGVRQGCVPSPAVFDAGEKVVIWNRQKSVLICVPSAPN